MALDELERSAPTPPANDFPTITAPVLIDVDILRLREAAGSESSASTALDVDGSVAAQPETNRFPFRPNCAFAIKMKLSY